MEEITNIRSEDIEQLMKDVAMIKSVLLSGKIYDDEGELSDWAINELREARLIPDSENISLEEMEKMICAK